MEGAIRLPDYPYIIERIKGVIHQMARPALNHIEAGDNLTMLIKKHFRGKECKFFSEPLVQLGADEVVPDICVVCDRSKLTKTRIVGAPDLVIEILSPSTRKKDVEEKYPLYEECGVREYWMVDPQSGHVEIHVLGSDGKYEKPLSYPFQTEDEKKDLVKYGRPHAITEEFTSVIFPDLTIQLSALFDYLNE